MWPTAFKASKSPKRSSAVRYMAYSDHLNVKHQGEGKSFFVSTRCFISRDAYK